MRGIALLAVRQGLCMCNDVTITVGTVCHRVVDTSHKGHGDHQSAHQRLPYEQKGRSNEICLSCLHG